MQAFVPVDSKRNTIYKVETTQNFTEVYKFSNQKLLSENHSLVDKLVTVEDDSGMDTKTKTVNKHHLVY